MKVLVNTPKLSLPGGVANFFDVLSKYFPDSIVYNEVGIRELPVARFLIFRLICDYLVFAWRLLTERFDIVHLNPSFGMRSILRDGIFLCIAKLFRLPCIVYFHGWDKSFAKLVFEEYGSLFAWIYWRADRFVVLAEEFRVELVNQGCLRPIDVETTVVDDNIFLLAPADRTSMNLLFLARLEIEKGIHELLAATTILSQKNLGIRLVVAGVGPAQFFVEEYINSNLQQNVDFLGYVEGDARIHAYQDAAIYLLPSYYGEGMPTSVLEAMAFGLPIITTPVGGLRDFFEDGRMGFLVDPVTPETIAVSVERLLSDPLLCQEIGLYNREYARKRFAASVVAGRLLGIYEKVLANA